MKAQAKWCNSRSLAPQFSQLLLTSFETTRDVTGQVGLPKSYKIKELLLRRFS